MDLVWVSILFITPSYRNRGKPRPKVNPPPAESIFVKSLLFILKYIPSNIIKLCLVEDRQHSNEIGRASCRGRGVPWESAGSIKKRKTGTCRAVTLVHLS